MELYSGGGLTVLAWLEAPGGRVEAEGPAGKTPSFPIVMGTNYEVISAVFGNGKMLARLANFSLHLPTELRERQKKKYGTTDNRRIENRHRSRNRNRTEKQNTEA